MKEIIKGVFHWETYHEGIEKKVHSYYIYDGNFAAVVDPRVPDVGFRQFDKLKKPQSVFLTNRHHFRHSELFQKAFDCEIYCHARGIKDLEKEPASITAFQHGETLAGGVHALRVGEICEDETLFLVPFSRGVIFVGDALIREEGELSFVEDRLMGDHPHAVKKGLLMILRQHLELPFSHLMLAHGQPVLTEAKKSLRQFLEKMEKAEFDYPKVSGF